MLSLHNLTSVKGAKRKKKLLGRGPGSGHGKTSTRGHKGQRSRAGRDFYPGFEGGQSPLVRRIPKRGFSHINKYNYQLINIKDLSIFLKNSVVDAQALKKSGLIKNHKGLVKVLGDGELANPITIKANKFSKSAVEKIQKAGGNIRIVK